MPNTERLFYADPYQREFSARMIARREMAGQPAVALDRTAFYPTGGGQPHDTGSLRPATWTAEADGVSVIDVVAEDGLIWHILSAPLAGDEITGALDWPRRFDHMQQHTGQHILSQAFIVTCDAETVALPPGRGVEHDRPEPQRPGRRSAQRASRPPPTRSSMRRWP